MFTYQCSFSFPSTTLRKLLLSLKMYLWQVLWTGHFNKIVEISKNNGFNLSTESLCWPPTFYIKLGIYVGSQKVFEFLLKSGPNSLVFVYLRMIHIQMLFPSVREEEENINCQTFPKVLRKMRNSIICGDIFFSCTGY